MFIKKSQSGWDVVDGEGTVLASFASNKEAWRFVDLRSDGRDEPMSRGERVTNWINRKIIDR